MLCFVLITTTGHCDQWSRGLQPGWWRGYLSWQVVHAEDSFHRLLAWPTCADIIRFAPPLVITEEQLMACCRIIGLSMKQFA